MTIFLASLFLPKAVNSDLWRGTSNQCHQIQSLDETNRRVRPGLKQRPSLFTPLLPVSMPPGTAAEDASGLVGDAQLHDDEGLRIHDGGRSANYTDKESPERCARCSQHKYTVSSGASAPLANHTKPFDKAQELISQGVQNPRTHRSGSHGEIFANASWRIVNADQGNSGLQDAVDAVKGDIGHEGYTWVGIPGMPVDTLERTQQEQDIEDRLSTHYGMLPIFCSDKDFNEHYSHFCKGILWPVFHYQLPSDPKSNTSNQSWKSYVRVNQAFADKIIGNWKQGDTIWIHDYHLLLVPCMIRQKLPQAKVGLFLHVPFPSSEVFRCLAIRKELLEGMLGANLIGFQIDEYKRHFLHTCSRILNIEDAPDGVQLEERFVNVVSEAIGINLANLNIRRQDAEVARWINVLKGRHSNKKIIVARDKLDQMRGVPQKLLSYELFLNKYPDWRDKVVLIHITPPTSAGTGQDAIVEEIVMRINASHGTLESQPLVYLKQNIPYSQYLAILTVADALLITSQRDGMNLMPHEFLICQDGKYHDKRHGSLILSEFTGASALFGRNELTINPWSYQLCSEAIKKAIEQSEDAKASCWERLHKVVSYHTGGRWFTRFLQHLDLAYEEQYQQDQKSVPRLNLQKLGVKYERSNRRLFFLAFEGTLVPNTLVSSITSTSLQRTLSALDALLEDNRNIIYIMSDWRLEDLDRMFSSLPALGLIAENGCRVKEANSRSWTEVAERATINSWKEPVKKILQYYLERMPGTEIEEREYSLIFHYENFEDKVHALRQASECVGLVNDSCEMQRVHGTKRNDCVVVESLDWNKSTAAATVYERLVKSTNELGAVDFMMVVGKDRADERVFRWANKVEAKGAIKNVITVSLGSGNTQASATLMQCANSVCITLHKLASILGQASWRGSSGDFGGPSRN